MTGGVDLSETSPRNAAATRPIAKGVNAGGILPKFAEQVKGKNRRIFSGLGSQFGFDSRDNNQYPFARNGRSWTIGRPLHHAAKFSAAGTHAVPVPWFGGSLP